MIAFAFVGQEELDIKRLQGRLIERQRTFDIADSQNHVVDHCSLLQITSASTAFSPLDFASPFGEPFVPIVTFEPLCATKAPYSFSSKASRKIFLARNKRDLVAATEMPASSATSFTERSLD
jgi:hypothetical protein